MNAAYMPDRIAAWLVKDENSSIVIGQFCERGTFVPPPDSPPAREYVGVELLTTAEERARVAELWVADLQSGMYVNCVYCGYRYGRREEVPESMADVLKAHIEKCPKHPMSLLSREYAKAKEALPILQELLDTHNEANPWLGVVAAATLRTNELEDLRTLRRTSVRVDVLLRWIYAINRKFRPTPVMVRMAELLGSRLTRRSLRKEGE